MDIRQFKLANDEEIICEIVEYHDEGDAIVIRKSLRLVSMDNLAQGTRYYAFRPFMMFQMKPGAFQVLSGAHIVAECEPHDEMVNEYFKSLEQFMKEEDDIDNVSVDEMRAEMKAHLNSLQEGVEYLGKDSGDQLSNILKFKPKSTIH
jgi:hypothetical protein